jgi:hypothetical protein
MQGAKTGPVSKVALHSSDQQRASRNRCKVRVLFGRAPMLFSALAQCS